MNEKQSHPINHSFFNRKPVKNTKEYLPPDLRSIIGQKQRTFLNLIGKSTSKPPPLFFSDINLLVPKELTFIFVKIT
jgi:hypothetical protein